MKRRTVFLIALVVIAFNVLIVASVVIRNTIRAEQPEIRVAWTSTYGNLSTGEITNLTPAPLWALRTQFMVSVPRREGGFIVGATEEVAREMMVGEREPVEPGRPHYFSVGLPVSRIRRVRVWRPEGGGWRELRVEEVIRPEG